MPMLEAAVLLEERSAAALLAQALAPISLMLGIVPLRTSVARHLGAAAALLGQPDKARAYYQQALEVCAKVRFRPEIALTHLQLAELLLEQAETPSPQSSPKGRGRSPSPPGRGQGEGEALRKEALEHLDFAIAEFQEMKMQTYLERALRHKGLLKA